MANQEFWLDDPSILYKNNNYTKIFPDSETSNNDQLNAITRFCLYAITIIFIFTITDITSFIAIFMVIIILVIFYKKYGNKQDNFSEIRFVDKNDLLENYNIPVYPEKIVKEYPYKASYEDDNMFYPSLPLEKPNSYCRLPSPENPMMNPSAVDYNELTPAACNADDNDIQENIKVNFNQDLFRDVDELWERANSQRQFYTLPNTAVPNNQTEFAKWLYQLPNSAICKEDQEGCLRYDDLIYNGSRLNTQ
jgi:hypothetical protein